MPELPMRFHLLADVKCPECGKDLVFIRVRQYGDLYRCASGPCRRQVLHYCNKEAQTCGYVVLSRYGKFSVWTACDMRAAKGE
jgi:hypothetical protein